MRRTSRLVLLLGIFLAALVFVVVVLFMGGRGPGGGVVGTPAPTAAQELTTVIAAQDIPLGTVVTQDMFSTRPIITTAREANALGDISQAVGKTTRSVIVTGAQVHSTDFQDKAVKFTVPQGKRAFAISISQLTGVGNLLDTGDTVDLIISLRGDAFPVVQVLADGSISVVAGVNPLSVKLPLLLQDVQIIATIEPPPPAAPQGQANQPVASRPPQYTGDVIPKLLILAVTPQQAEVLLFARTTGTLDAVLRSPADAGVIETTTGIILKSLVDQYGVLPPELVQVPIPTPS